MKKITIIILLILVYATSFSQNTWVKWNGHIFLKQGNDSTYFGEDDILSTMPAILSGTNVKTINGNSLMGSGNLVVGGGGAWGSITGTLSSQTDLITALNLKATLASPTFTGTVAGITSSMVGLGNVTNESKATMFSSPTFTGTITFPAASIANAALANASVANLSGTNTGDNATNTQYSGLAASKQNTITTGTTSQYFRGDLSLATFPTTTASFVNSTDKNFVTDAKLTVINNTTGTNSGDNAANTTYANDFRAANFVAGTNYLAPNGSAAALTSFPTLNQNTTGTSGGLSANIAESQVTNLVTDLAGKQATLVSATNIKTVNGSSLLGAGDIAISGTAAWGSVTGTLSNQTDLQTALNGKQATGNYATGGGTATGTNTGDQTTVSGNAGTATALQNARTINGQSFDGTANITIPGSAVTAIPISSITNYTGYTLQVQALTSSPTDAQTIFFGNMPKAPTTTAATSKIFIRKTGTIKMAEIYCFSGTAGTNEAWVMSIRLNNTTDTQIASVALATSERIFSNTALNIAVVAGDFIEIKCVNPTWSVNPLTTIFGGYIYIE